MTPEQKLKHLVLLKSVEFGAEALPDEVTADNVDALYDERNENDDGNLQDAHGSTNRHDHENHQVQLQQIALAAY